MTHFDYAINIILRHEGGFVNDPDDPGGATNFGISFRWASKIIPSCNNTDFIKNLTKDEAIEIYKKYIWATNRYDDIKDRYVATKIFDMAVNMGSSRAIKLVQTALNNLDSHIKVDGIMGSITIDAINNKDNVRLLKNIVSVQADFYRSLAKAKPNMHKFLKAWLHRSAWPLKK